VFGLNDIDSERIDRESDSTESKSGLIAEQILDGQINVESGSFSSNRDVGHSTIFQMRKRLVLDPELDSWNLGLDVCHLEEGACSSLFSLELSQIEIELRIQIEVNVLRNNIVTRNGYILDSTIKILGVIFDSRERNLLEMFEEQRDHHVGEFAHKIRVEMSLTRLIYVRELLKKSQQPFPGIEPRRDRS